MENIWPWHQLAGNGYEVSAFNLKLDLVFRLIRTFSELFMGGVSHRNWQDWVAACPNQHLAML